MRTYEDTSIWINSLGNNKKYKKEKEQLRSAYRSFRNNVKTIVSNIYATFPNLTIHDGTHIDALWRIASLITGKNYPISPLEGFILGGAILLHDAALCFEAYEGGEEGVRATKQWKDCHCQLKESDPKLSPEELLIETDFFTLRLLHAIQAELLIERTWSDPDTGNKIYLLEDNLLRKHYGILIGQIASSHHWNIETLASKFSTQINALPNFPNDWQINPIKLACILRCADAAHIDNSRAPDFYYALNKRSGLSFNHWQAQNRLSIDMVRNDNKKLIYTSATPFRESESESWFIAYDAACIVDKEIKSCNQLLENLKIDILQIEKVFGVESLDSFAKCAPVNNWKPCCAQIHISNIEKIVQNLGGEMLYGAHSDKFEIVIRELIQNARDAIIARKYVDNGFNSDKITITLQQKDDDVWLLIEDNGIGMSERVLTNSLLDFGTSFWYSDLVRDEFPGLRSSGFNPIGKYGIGFYSNFMISETISVASKNWDKGLDSIHELKFNKGLSLRPILTEGRKHGFSPAISTQIKIKLKENLISPDLKIEIKRNLLGSHNFFVPFDSYLKAICSGLDVPLFYVENDNEEVLIHESIIDPKLDKLKWIKDISFSDYQEKNNEEIISKSIDRLKPIVDDKKIYGLAAINTHLTNEQNFLNIITVGGLAHTVHQRGGFEFIGYIDCIPKSAKRDTGKFACSIESIQKWANEQRAELMKLNLNSTERYCAAIALCKFNVDPTEIAHVYMSYEMKNNFYTIDQMVDKAVDFGIVFIESAFGNHVETHIDIPCFDKLYLFKPLINSSFLSLEMSDGIPKNNNGILDCLYRGIIRKNYTPFIERKEKVIKNSLGYLNNIIIVRAKEQSY